jgi:hypothetical protein
MARATLILFDEQGAIDRVAAWVSNLRQQLSREWSRERLTELLRQSLRGIDVSDDQRLTIAIKAVEAADAGDEIADGALREVGSELMERPTGRPGDGQILAYLQRAARRDLHKRSRGRPWADEWVRNILICTVVQVACVEFNILPTRNRASRRANRDPSGCSLAAAGLARNKIYLAEESIQRHLWLGLPGALAQKALFELITKELAV